jgi:signal transduction histidine kinase
VAALLIAVFALTATLTWQAASAARAHRLAAEQTVRDFAAIGSDELIRRAAFELETTGIYPIRASMLGPLSRAWEMPPRPAGSDERMRHALPLLKERFLFDARSGRVDPAGLDPQLAEWLRDHLVEELNARRRAGEQSLRVTIGGREQLIAVGIGLMDDGRYFGFTVHEQAIAPFVDRAYARRPLFPPSIGGGGLTNESLFVEVSRGGQIVFRSPGRFDPRFGVRRTLSAEYGGVFRGATVRSSIDPAVAPRLVSGGVPPSRIPMLSAVLVLAAILLGAAAFLLRRERQLAALRSDFVSGVSHELRTPLTQIRMFSETLLLDRIRSQEERKRSMAIIDQEARRLAHLVEKVLTFARSERGMLELAAADHDARALIGDTVELFKPLARSNRVTIETDVEAAAPVHVDADSFRQVLLNLLENAVKYGPAGQTITVRARLDDGSFRVEVEDQGPGIPESQREAIFRKFVRLERDRGTHKAGTGIGLAVVREIVALHGGRCWVQSAAGGGARFVVEVPA